MSEKLKREVHVSSVRRVIRRFFVRCPSCGAKCIASLSGKLTDVQDLSYLGKDVEDFGELALEVKQHGVEGDER